MGTLNGKVAVVTGGARGLGFAIAELFAKQGADVAIVDRDGTGAQRAAGRLQDSSGGRALGVQTNVGDPDEVERCFGRVASELGDTQILVNNAGMDTTAEVARMPLEMWDDMMRVNLRSVFLCTRAVLPPMMQARYGRIINISSQLAHKGAATMAHYTAAKAGVIGFTRALALEVSPYNILANAIAPGPLETDLWSALPKSGGSASSPSSRWGASARLTRSRRPRCCWQPSAATTRARRSTPTAGMSWSEAATASTDVKTRRATQPRTHRSTGVPCRPPLGWESGYLRPTSLMRPGSSSGDSARMCTWASTSSSRLPNPQSTPMVVRPFTSPASTSWWRSPTMTPCPRNESLRRQASARLRVTALDSASSLRAGANTPRKCAARPSTSRIGTAKAAGLEVTTRRSATSASSQSIAGTSG